MTEKVERIARTVLWFTLALVFIGIPIAVAKSQFGDSALRTELKAQLNTTAENFSIGQVSCDGAIWPKIWTNLAPPDSSSISTVSVPT